MWLQCDAAGDGQVAAVIAGVILECLLGDRPNRYRPLLVGRARIAVVPPADPGPSPGEAPGADGAHGETSTSWGMVPPILDAGALGVTSGLLRALADFAPTLLIHLQDWPAAGQGQGPLAGAGLRLVESFHLTSELHQRLGANEARRSWLGRPTALTRTLAAHPDARIGARARRHVERMGYRVFRPGDETVVARHDPSWPAVIRLAPGRYIPRLEWRRLGAASLSETALDRFGALALCGQTFGQPAAERAGAALALVEGAIIYRFGLEIGEPAR